MTPVVEVLLATHNGERFLGEQVDSLLAQTWQPLRITVSDDTSTDSTAELLAGFATAHPDVLRILPGGQRFASAQANFLHLMDAATAPYVCFCDQDDVWLPDKIAQSMAAMQTLEEAHGAQTPLLVFTDLRVVDAALNTIAPSMWQHLSLRPQSVHSLPRLLGQTVVTGCTMLINQPLLALAQQMPPEATMHDRWIALLAAAMGASAALESQTVLYRQHDRNVIGATAADSSAAAVASRTADDTGRRAERLRSQRQARALLRLHTLPAASAHILEDYLESGTSPSAMRRIWLTLTRGFYRATPLQTAALLAMLARSAVDDR